MPSTKGLVAILGIVALLVMGIACSNGEADTKSEVVETPQGAQQIGAATQTTPAQALSSAGLTPAMMQVPSTTAGIWVTGRASISVEPDLVLLNIGVEAMAETVAKARGQAAQAMDAIIQAVKGHGLEDKDVQTQSFNIWPRYEYPEVTSGGSSTRKQVLVGYTVNNTARIKIRNVDDVGAIIDDVADAGGEVTRINDINFSIEDPKPFMTQLREEAVKDAIAKAEHFATLAGVAVGDLVFIGEVGAGTPAVRDFSEDAMMMRTAAAVDNTSVSGGELELSLNVQAAFSIDSQAGTTETQSDHTTPMNSTETVRCGSRAVQMPISSSSIRCLCPPEGRARVKVTVRNTEVVRVDFTEPTTVSGTGWGSLRNTEVPADKPLPSGVHQLYYSTIDELFERIETHIHGGAHRVSVEYDSRHGYPTEVLIDQDTRIADDELSFTIANYKPAAE